MEKENNSPPPTSPIKTTPKNKKIKIIPHKPKRFQRVVNKIPLQVIFCMF